MSMPIATIGQTAVGICCAHSKPPCIPSTGVVGAGAATVMAGGQPVARIGDVVILACGHTAVIGSGSPTVTTEGIPTARLGDSVVGPFTGNLVTGVPTVTCA